MSCIMDGSCIWRNYSTKDQCGNWKLFDKKKKKMPWLPDWALKRKRSNKVHIKPIVLSNEPNKGFIMRVKMLVLYLRPFTCSQTHTADHIDGHYEDAHYSIFRRGSSNGGFHKASFVHEKPFARVYTNIHTRRDTHTQTCTRVRTYQHN